MSLFASLLLFVAVATFTPGGATALAASSGMRHGVHASLPLLAGLIFGVTSLACASALGLGGVMMAWPSMRLLLAAAGTAYFLWLAAMIALSGRPDFEAERGAGLGFFAGVLLLWLNPKAWTMTLGAAASFGPLAPDPVGLALLLGGVFLTFSTAALTAWCLGGALVAKRLRSERQWRVLNLTLAALLVLSVVPIWMEPS